MILYHGSPNIISQPLYGVGNPHNDYGLGFYCTESQELAKEWACASESGGYANRYEFEIEGLKVLNLSNGEYNILNWLAILLENRTFRISSDIARQGKEYLLSTFKPPYEDYDVIEGYRADDSYFSFANGFLNNTISLSKLERAMVLGKLGMQIVPKSEKAFSRIHFLDSEPADGAVYYRKRMERDTAARETYRAERGQPGALDDHYMLDILRGRWSNDDPRLHRVVLG